jgi:CubicO group peptidase (beta-lactamase class C family)
MSGDVSAGGFSKTRLERVHDVLGGYVERGELPGLVSLVSRRGEIHADAIGTTAIAGKQPMQRDTIFRISSMTKPLTAVATMILVEECKLRLDDPVDELLPDLADRQVLKRLDGPLDETVPAVRPITTRDLLTFTFGFGLVFGPDPIAVAVAELMLGQGPPSPASTPEPDVWIRRFGTLPLLHQPGARWMYNTGSDVLGVLIARASGQSFDTFLRDRIFDPLGMRDTGFSVPASDLGRFATGYMSNFETGALEPSDEPGGQWSRPPAFPAGGAGLVSTVDDFAAFAQMLLNRGTLRGERILSRPSVGTMTTNQLTPEQRAIGGLVPGIFDNRGWGFGVSVVTNRIGPAQPEGRYGWDGGLGTSWFNDPDEQLTAILMTQRAWSSPQPPLVCEDFWTSVYQAIDD